MPDDIGDTSPDPMPEEQWWDLEDLTDQLRSAAARERAEHGKAVHLGPFEMPPLGLAASTSADFRLSGGNQARVGGWLLGQLHRRRVEVGEFDIDMVNEIATILGPDAAQAVGGWVARAAPSAREDQAQARR